MADPAGGVERLRAVRAVLFDFDGTLVQQRVDFARMRRRAIEVLQGHGVDTTAIEGLHVLEMVERARRSLAQRDAARAQALADDARRTIEAVECEAAEEARAIAGVPALLRDLRARGVRVGIVTRNCRVAVERVLARQVLAYDVLLTRDDVQHVKPDPRHLGEALRLLGVAGEASAMCGDHPMDVVAGKGVGALTVGVLPEGSDPASMAAAAPDLIVPSVAALRDPLGLDGAQDEEG